MRDLERRLAARCGGTRCDGHDLAGDPAEAVMAPVLQPRRRHELHADADAEEGSSLADHRLLEGLRHAVEPRQAAPAIGEGADQIGKSTRLNSKSLMRISYAVFCLKKKTTKDTTNTKHLTMT